MPRKLTHKENFGLAFRNLIHELGSSRFQLTLLVMFGAVFFSLKGSEGIARLWMEALFIVLGYFFASKTVGSFAPKGYSGMSNIVGDLENEEKKNNNETT